MENTIPAKATLADDVALVAPALGSARGVALAPVSRATWVAAGEAIVGLVLSWLGFVVMIVLVVGAALVPVFGIGVPVVALALVAGRGLARAERHRLGLQLDAQIPAPVRAAGTKGRWWRWSTWWRTLRDGRTWAHLGYLGIWPLLASLRFMAVYAMGAALALVLLRTDLPVVPNLLVAVVGALVGLWFAAVATQCLALAQLRLARGLLGVPASQRSAEAARSAQERAAEAEERAEHLDQTRTRAVGAADEDRRRIERDLHDGAQQRLVALGVELGSARRRVSTDPQSATAALDHAHAEVKATLAELRDLVRGIHPAVLTDRGLDAALSALAARSPVPVVVVVPDPTALATTSSAAQAAAYFVTAEALTNAAKHSGATGATVTAEVDGDRLRLTVADDGSGGASATDGSGLDGLRARIEALDGTFDLDSPAGAGTRLTVEVPCAS